MSIRENANEIVEYRKVSSKAVVEYKGTANWMYGIYRMLLIRKLAIQDGVCIYALHKAMARIQ